MVYITGDTHGELIRFQDKALNRLGREDYLLVCGDFGFFWDNSSQEQKAIKWLSKRKYTILFVEGTHDNLDMVESVTPEQWNGGKVRRLAGNILQLCRGEVFKLDGNYLFAMGGGESPDMDVREASGVWWERELPTPEELSYAQENLARYRNVVDYIVSYDCPSALQKNLLSQQIPPHEGPLNRFFDQLSKECRFKQWYFGCYHTDKRMPPYHTAVFQQIIPLR